MATCKTNCIHYPVCGIWDRKIFVDYDNDIMSDFADLSNVEDYCKHYLPTTVEAEWIPQNDLHNEMYACSNCQLHIHKDLLEHFHFCSKCGAKMVGRR